MTGKPHGTGREQGSDMSRTQLSDETLMAYADGELDAEAAAAVESSIAADSEVAVRITGFLRSRRLARAALASRLETVSGPLPPALQGVARAAIPVAAPDVEAPPNTSAEPRVIRVGRWMSPTRVAPALMAASIVAAAGLVGYLSASRGAGTLAQPPGVLAILDDERVGAVLSRLPTGQDERIDGMRLRAVGTYRLANGGVCRDLVVERQVEAGEVVACRNGPAAAWEMRLGIVSPNTPDTYAPAGGKDLVDAFLDREGAGSPVAGEAEKALLAGKAP